MKFDEWLRTGLDSGFIEPPMCGTHDTGAANDEEYESDDCIWIVRLTQEKPS